ncbi:MAG TPA: 23S rRNA (adenine(2503)-C(2))-methyltransferase RlmN [Thermoanaerobaculia bacterium]|nr:23S rRNA (adenine(2503)-C(2))-methyltransferase RlmN [Thermoanaerobaculia bacterium]
MLTIVSPSAMPWDRKAPEKEGLPSAWALLPEDLVSGGCPGRPELVFSRLQRVRTWERDRPFVSRHTRAWMEAHADLSLPAIVARQPSADGSTKLALELSDGHRVEAVHMPRKDGDRRVTYCISSQVGCALGCTFCATGAMGIVRNLTAGEIVGQVLALMHQLGPKLGESVTLVFMGMGEPLHNLDHVHRAITVLCHPEGALLSPWRITVSTSGLVSGIEKLARMSPRPLLAVSLNATTDAARSATMPVNRAWNLARLRQALDAWELKRHERLLFEYVLLAGENDTLEDADRLADWLGELRHRHTVNLIPMNEHAHSPFREPADPCVQSFAARLHQHGCFVTVRRSRGRDVQGACGQLVRRGESEPAAAMSPSEVGAAPS